MDMTYFDDVNLHHYWLGATDLERDTFFRFSDGTSFDEAYNDPNFAFDWAVYEPNNLHNREHCLEMTVDNKLNDARCFRPLNEDQRNRGLCERKTFTCVTL